MLALACVIDPGDEAIVFDPYFSMYRHLTTLAGGVSVLVNTYPDFRIDVEKVRTAITARTKCVLVNSPNNPTGIVAAAAEMKALADLCKEKDVLLISDEVYASFCYDHPFSTPAEWNVNALVVDGFSKSHGMTGWRLGYAHGPAQFDRRDGQTSAIQLCLHPSIAQYAGAIAFDRDLTTQTANYRRKRNMVVNALGDLSDLAIPEGAFYAFPRTLGGPEPSSSPRRSKTISSSFPATCSVAEIRIFASPMP